MNGRRCPQSWPCQPGHQGSSGGESKSVKERVNEPIFESWWLGFLSVSFSTLTTAEEPKSLKCIWNKTCICFPLNISGCKTQTIPRPSNIFHLQLAQKADQSSRGSVPTSVVARAMIRSSLNKEWEGGVWEHKDIVRLGKE